MGAEVPAAGTPWAAGTGILGGGFKCSWRFHFINMTVSTVTMRVACLEHAASDGPILSSIRPYPAENETSQGGGHGSPSSYVYLEGKTAVGGIDF